MVAQEERHGVLSPHRGILQNHLAVDLTFGFLLTEKGTLPQMQTAQSSIPYWQWKYHTRRHEVFDQTDNIRFYEVETKRGLVASLYLYFNLLNRKIFVGFVGFVGGLSDLSEAW